MIVCGRHERGRVTELACSRVGLNSAVDAYKMTKLRVGKSNELIIGTP